MPRLIEIRIHLTYIIVEWDTNVANTLAAQLIQLAFVAPL